MEQQGIGAPATGFASGALPSSAALPTGRSDRSNSCAEPEVLLHADWRRELRQTIVARVLPRLSPPPGAQPLPSRARVKTPFTDESVARFADASLATGIDGLLVAVDGFIADGATLEAVFLDLLSPAARHLGDLWLADRLSFFDVTAGLGRLQAVVRALGPNFEGRATGSRQGGRILLSPVAGEHHVFGLSIVAAFFRRAGWIVAFEPTGISEDLLARVQAGDFDAVGLSAAGDAAVSSLPALVAAIRLAAGARSIAILLGGPAALADPALCDKVGADAVARDATEAVQIADALLRRAVAA